MPERSAFDLRRRRSFRAIVRDESMLPTLTPGDRLWVERRAVHDSAPALGAIVVVRDPESRRRLLVKRVAFVGPGTAWSTRTGFDPGATDAPPTGAVEEWDVAAHELLLSSDRPRGSRDSRRFGPVPLRDVLGTVWFRYAPVPRRGLIGGGPSR